MCEIIIIFSDRSLNKKSNEYLIGKECAIKWKNCQKILTFPQSAVTNLFLIGGLKNGLYSNKKMVGNENGRERECMIYPAFIFRFRSNRILRFLFILTWLMKWMATSWCPCCVETIKRIKNGSGYMWIYWWVRLYSVRGKQAIN